MSKPFDGWTIVFDLDGTLVNTAPDLLEALNHVLTNADLTPVTLDTIATMIGHGARAMIVKGLLAHGITPSDSDLDVFLEQFLDYYAANIADHSHAFDGVVEAMTSCWRNWTLPVTSPRLWEQTAYPTGNRMETISCARSRPPAVRPNAL